MSLPPHAQNPSKIPLSLDQADKIDRNISLLADNLESLVSDIALMLYGTPGDPRLRAVQTELKAALKRLEAAKTPARALWIEADAAAAASTHQGDRHHG
jgi:hypothetical protein